MMAVPGWTARPPGPSRAMRSSPRWSPATSIPACSMTWSGCAWNWIASSTAPPSRRAPGRHPARRATGRRTRRDSASPSREALRKAIIGKAVDLLSGPGGLAVILADPAARCKAGRAQLAAWTSASARPSRPASVTPLSSETGAAAGPAAATSPPQACEVHHVKHKAHGGPTSLTGCVLLCSYHHQIVIHRWGWTLVLNPDGTTTAWNPRPEQGAAQPRPARAG